VNTDWDWVASKGARELHLHLYAEQLTTPLSTNAQSV